MPELCAREACSLQWKDKDNDGFVRIWNQSHEFPPYRDYCIACGRSIVEANPGIKHEVHKHDRTFTFNEGQT